MERNDADFREITYRSLREKGNKRHFPLVTHRFYRQRDAWLIRSLCGLPGIAEAYRITDTEHYCLQCLKTVVHGVMHSWLVRWSKFEYKLVQSPHRPVYGYLGSLDEDGKQWFFPEPALVFSWHGVSTKMGINECREVYLESIGNCEKSSVQSRIVQSDFVIHKSHWKGTRTC